MPELIGKYRIIEPIGRGGMGTVYKAHDPVLDRLVALKVISADGDVTDEMKARFYREAQACAKLSHPNIVVVHDLGEDAGRLFIVMEFLEGEELKHVIAERRPASLAEKLGWMIQVCDGLHYAHQKGIIHRDVKPGNIFLLRNGQLKILDFGIARITAGTDPGLTQTGHIMGTLRYMSPEQARGRVDHRSDIFSVGAVFYEILSYRPAFDAEHPMEILEKLRSAEPAPLTELDPTIPPALAALVERALRKDPARRFADLGEMRTELEAIRRGLGDEAERLEAQVRAQLAELTALEAALARLLGQAPEDATLPIRIDRSRPDELRSLAADLGERVARLRARVRQAEAAEPVLARADALTRAGDRRGATAALDGVLREIPEHARARAQLEAARGGATVPRARPEPAPAAPPTPAAPRETIRPVTGPPAPEPSGSLRTKVLGGLTVALLVAIGAYAIYSPTLREPTPSVPAAPGPAAPVPGPAAPVPAAPRPAPAAPAKPATPAPGPAAPGSGPTARAPAVTPPPTGSGGDVTDASIFAKQAATAAAAARAEAERAEAARWAAKTFAAAREKESAGQAAADRQDHAAAARRFQEAQDEYQRAVREARAAAEAERQRVAALPRAPAEDTAALRAEVDRLRESAVSTREQALRTGADRLAREPFEAGRAKEAEGVALERRQSLAAARDAYQEAGQRYGEALSRAQVARPAQIEADQARARMQSDKQKARPDSADYRAALAEEQRGDARYESAAYKEAAGAFRAAAVLFARAAAAVPETPAADPRAEIRSVLALYKQAIERKDLALFQKVRPGMSNADVQQSFDQTKSHTVDLTIQNIDVQGEEAEARGRRLDVVVRQDGQTFRNEAGVVFKLRRRAAGWVIDAINAIN